MIQGTRGGRSRRRRERSRVVLKWLFGLFVLGLVGVYAYRTGVRLAQIETEGLQREIAALSKKAAERDRREAAHRDALEAAQTRADRWQRAFEREVPDGDAKILFDAVTAKLAEGVSSDRLSFVIAASSDQRDCEPALATKRFIVTTPLQRIGPNNAVSFHNGTVVVTAIGASASDGNGNAEAWFDPAQPVRVRAVALSGEEHEETGLLPLHLSLVVGSVEHRLGVLAGPTRGFVQTSLQTCRYP